MHFFDLSREMREKIYLNVFRGCNLTLKANFEVDNQNPLGYKHNHSRVFDGDWELLLSCKWGYRDAIGSYYKAAHVVLQTLDFVHAVKLSKKGLFCKQVTKLAVMEYEPDALVVFAKAADLKVLEVKLTCDSNFVVHEGGFVPGDILVDIAYLSLLQQKAFRDLLITNRTSRLLPKVEVFFSVGVQYDIAFNAQDRPNESRTSLFTFDFVGTYESMMTQS